MFDSQVAVVCISPPSPPANVTISVSFNGVDYHTASSQFNFQPDLFVQSLFPTFGPTSGNTLVHIHESFSLGQGGCKFGYVAFMAESIYPDEIVCRVPPHMPGVVVVEVSVDMLDWSSNLTPA